MDRPADTEYAGFYATYTRLVPDGDVLETLRTAPDDLEKLLASVTSEHEMFAYAPGKWSIRAVVGHVVDAERLFGYRALHFARGDTAELPGMEQDEWASASNAVGRDLSGLLNEFRALRTANALFFESLDDSTLSRTGIASGASFTVRSLLFIMAGHEIHHRGVLRERYLPHLSLA